MLTAIGDYGRRLHLRTLADLVDDVEPIRIARDCLGDGVEAGIQVAQRQISRHDLAAVLRDQVLRIRLTGAEIQAFRRELRFRQRAVALDLSSCAPRDRALCDLKDDVDVTVVTLDRGHHLRLAVSCRAIGLLKILSAGLNQFLAVLAVREPQLAGLLHAEMRLQFLVAEAVVPIDSDLRRP